MYTADVGKEALSYIPLHETSVPIIFDVDPASTKMFNGLGWGAWDL